MRHASVVLGVFAALTFLLAGCHRAFAPQPPPPMPDLDSLARAAHPDPGPRPVDSVDVPPVPVSQPPVRYPNQLRSAGVQGWVVIEFVVDTAGQPEAGGIRVLASSHLGFEAPAVEAILQSRYHPGRVRGVPVRVLVMRSVEFAIHPVDPGPADSATPRFGISVVGNVPTEPLGVGFWYLPARRVGVYGDVKVGVPIRDQAPNFFGDLTIDEVNRVFGDPFVRTDRFWGSINVALTKSVTERLAIYVGGGVSGRYEYLEYRDQNGVLVDPGDTYWIEDDDQRVVRANVLVGSLVRLNRWALLQLGAELQPAGVTVGLGFHPPTRN